VVVKNLESNYQRIDHISGATIMGDGRVALILDVIDLIRRSRPPRGDEYRAAAAADAKRQPPSRMPAPTPVPMPTPAWALAEAAT
jgi:chemotaxis protein histidine kinase CheA